MTASMTLSNIIMAGTKIMTPKKPTFERKGPEIYKLNYNFI